MATKNLGTKSLRVARGVQNAIKEVWSYGTGKAGIILLVLLLLISAYASVTMPPGFISLWESAAYWDENPQLAPPAWICSFGARCANHFVKVKTNPDLSYSMLNRIYYNYTFAYDLTSDAFPQDLIIKIVDLCVLIVNQKAIIPVVIVSVTRPDGLTVTVSSYAATGITVNYTSGEGVIFVGSKDTPIRLGIDSRSLVNSIINYYNLSIPVTITGKNEAIQMLGRTIVINRVEDFARRHAQDLLFGYPKLTVIVNNQTKNIEKFTNMINNIINSVSSESSEKVDYLRKELMDIRNELYSIGKSNISLSDFVQNLRNLQKRLENVWKMAFIDLLLPPEKLNELYDLCMYLSVYIDQLTYTTAFFDVYLATFPLKGRYTITVTIIYDVVGSMEGVTGSLSSPAGEVRVIVKGSAYGVLGTDDLGRDLAKLLLYGFPIALGIGAFAAVVTTIIGVLLGIISGYYGGWIDEVVQRTADIIGNIPWLPLLIIMAQIAQQVFALYPPATKALMIMLTILGVMILTGWGGLAITVRAMILSIKEEPYVEAAIALGATHRRVIMKHIAPQVAIYAVANLVSGVPSAVLTEAGLSVLGIRHGWPTWGAVLSRARDLGRYDIWWWILPPGILLAVTSLTFIMLGFAIEKIVEPRLRTL
ncbi:MAG: ABC transporter permease [Thermofilum sp.]|jgi:peptide/nickel transport system permease protein|nr:ABC transporter permease [Thermofilum sp.]